MQLAANMTGWLEKRARSITSSLSMKTGGLEKISSLFNEIHLEVSTDEVFGLEEVNKALRKVASGVSKGKAVLRIS